MSTKHEDKVFCKSSELNADVDIQAHNCSDMSLAVYQLSYGAPHAGHIYLGFYLIKIIQNFAITPFH